MSAGKAQGPGDAQTPEGSVDLCRPRSATGRPLPQASCRSTSEVPTLLGAQPARTRPLRGDTARCRDRGARHGWFSRSSQAQSCTPSALPSTSPSRPGKQELRPRPALWSVNPRISRSRCLRPPLPNDTEESCRHLRAPPSRPSSRVLCSRRMNPIIACGMSLGCLEISPHM